MKISKDLLKQIALGVCFAGAITSCGIHDDDPLGEDHPEICSEAETNDDGDTKNDWSDCMACGMG